ncbi:MAG: polysaccharide biosynthesis C-terminal domain-containing protein [Sphingomicrobium sp.]
MIRALVSIGLLQFLSMLLLLVRTKIVALFLGPEGVGVIASLDRVTAVVAQTLSLSLPFAAVRFLPAAERRSPDEAEALYRAMRNVSVAMIVLATISCVAVTAISPQIWGSALVPYRGALLLAFSALPVVGLVPFLTNAFASTRGHLASMRFTVSNSLAFVFAAVAAAAGFGVAGFYGTYAVLGTALVLAGMAKLHVPGAGRGRHLFSFAKRFRMPREVWRFAIWLFPLTFAAPYAAWFVQYSVLSLYGAGSAGILQGAIGISLAVRTLLGAAHPIFLTPNVNRQADTAERMAWTNEFQRHTVIIFIAFLPPVLLFSDIELAILYAPAFIAAAPFVALFVATEVITLLSGSYQSLLLAENRFRFHVGQNIAAQVILAAIAALAIPRLGLAGAGLATLAAPIFLFGSTLWYLRRQFGVRPSPEASHMGWLTLGILLVCGLVGSLFTGMTIARLALRAAVCVVVWVAAFLVMPAEDRGRVRRTLADARTRGMALLSRRGHLT